MISLFLSSFVSYRRCFSHHLNTSSYIIQSVCFQIGDQYLITVKSELISVAAIVLMVTQPDE